MKKILVAICALLLTSVAVAATVEYTYDANGRLRGVYAPSGEAAQYVYDPAGNITQILRFAASQLQVVEFTPTSGPVGTTVQIYGTGFSATPGNNAVTFNGTAATVSASTPNKITTTVPTGATTGPIQVTVGAGSATSSTNFVVTSGSGNAPTITSFSPAGGAAGTAVTINGTNFDSTAALNNITFNTAFAAATSATSTALTASLPAIAASGKISVRTKSGSASSATDFIVPFGTFALSDIVANYRAVVDGATASYSISADTKVIYVLFDGVQNQNLGIGLTTNGCVVVYVQRPDNQELMPGTSACNNSSFDLVPLPLSGTYTVAIKASGAARSGVVTVSTDNAGTLGAEGAISTFSTTRAGQNGRYAFSGTSGQKAAFYVYGLASAVQPSRIDVIHPNGQVIFTTTSAGASGYIQTQTLPVTGKYQVLVSPAGVGTSSWSIQYGQPDLTVQSLTLGTVGAAQNGAFTIPITAVVKNQGTVGAKAITWYDEAYLSVDATLDTTDPKLALQSPAADVAAGATYTVNFTGTTATTTPTGNYTVFFKTDGYDSSGTYSALDVLKESDETNNVASASVNLPGRPDLVASNISFGSITVNQNGSYSFPVTFTVTNNGVLPAQASWFDEAYLSTDGTLDTTDRYLGYVTHGTNLAASASYNVTVNALTTTTQAPGAYTLFAKADGYDGSGFYSATSLLTEASETNNTVSTAITLPTRSDLTVSNLSVGTITVNTDQSYSIPVTFAVHNIGGSAAKATWYDECYLSSDSTLDTTDFAIGYLSHSVDLAASASYNVSLTCRTATTTTPGSYTLFVKTDGYDGSGRYSATSLLTEANEANNTASQAITLPNK